MDVHSAVQRSRNMAAIRDRDTLPELRVRSLLRSLGLRIGTNVRTLTGTPDIVLKKQCLAIFVHGCFWHMHRCGIGKARPKTNAEFWQAKRSANCRRDQRVMRALRKTGWHTVVIWECETRNPERLEYAVLSRILTHSG